jgi:hypothetical protein
MTREEACALLLRGAGVAFDPDVVDKFLTNLPRFEAEIAALNLNEHAGHQNSLRTHDSSEDSLSPDRNGDSDYLDQIKNAHREVYALYEIARTFGSSLDVKDTLSIIVNKVGHVVPFDTCAVYLQDDLKGYAEATHVAGKNSEILLGRSIAPGEGVTGFTLANRRSINRIDPTIARWRRYRSSKTNACSEPCPCIRPSSRITLTITCVCWKRSCGLHPMH